MATFHDKMTAIGDAIRSKTGTTGKLGLDDMASKIRSIQGGIDTSDATATVNDILQNKTAYVKGEKIRGTIAKVAQATPIISIDNSTGLVRAEATQNTGYVSAGTKTATEQLNTQSGEQIIPRTYEQTVVSAGTFVTGDITVSAMPTTTQAIPEITVDSSGLVVANSNQSAGYVTSGTKTSTYQLTTKDTANIKPGINNQYIDADTYITGTQTILGDSDLISSNIKKGVNIFDVNGTYDGLNFKILSGEQRPFGNINCGGFSYESGVNIVNSQDYITIISSSGTYNCVHYDFEVIPGETWSFSAQVDSGYTGIPRLGLRKWEGETVNSTLVASSTAIVNGEIKFTYTVPSGISKMRFELFVNYNDANVQGTITYRNVKMGSSTVNAIENTIWVNSSVPVTSYFFSTEKPIGEEGRVWFETGINSPGGFNAIPENNITIYPNRAEQFISGAWAPKEAHLYKDDQWAQFGFIKLWLYKNGDRNLGVTGDYYRNSPTSGITIPDGETAQGVKYLDLPNKSDETGLYEAYTIYTGNMIDVTAFTKLVSRSQHGRTGDRIQLRNSSLVVAAESNSNLDTSEIQTLKLDISALQGKFYVSLYNFNNGYDNYDLYELYLE